MGLDKAIYIVLTKSFTFLAWPPFSLLCPLFVSVRAMESDSQSSNQRCLVFWVLFSLCMIMEGELSVLFEGLPWWPHVKSIATILLLIPYIDAAPYVYKFLTRHYCAWSLLTGSTSNIFSEKSAHLESDEDSKLVDVSDHTITTSQMQEKKLESYQVLMSFSPSIFMPLQKITDNFKEKSTHVESDVNSKLVDVSDQTITSNQVQEKKHEAYQEIDDDIAGCDKTESSNTMLTSKNLAQKEWNCALCQISTTSKNCLKAHLKGKKHNDREKELRVELHHITQKRIKGMLLNQIANILKPDSRSKRWCEWTKPEVGWTKLNTDGSIHKDTASFGGLLRDYKGIPICAFVSKAPQGDVFLAELWGIWRGLVLSLGLGIKAIWVESDSMSVVKTVNKKQFCPKAVGYLKQIWKLLKKFDKYQISHSWRETNRAADHLAKMDLWANDVVLWPVDFPPSLCSIIKDDAKGTKYLRR